MIHFSLDWSELSLQVMLTFAHFLWQACVIGFVLFVVQHVVESLRDSKILSSRPGRKKGFNLGEADRRGANFRYTIACLAFFSLPICVAATFAWIHHTHGPIFLLATSEPAESIMTPAVIFSEPTPILESREVPALPTLEMTAKTEIPSIEPLEVFGSTPAAASWNDRFQSCAPYLLVAYAIVVCLMLARFGMSIVGSSRLRRTLQPITDSGLMKLIAEQSSRIGLKRLPIVALCERVSVPVVVGIVKPMILLPPALLCGLDPFQLAAILSHELAHIRRYDLIVNLLQRIVEALLFFHPVTWWISRRVSIERENCCDDLAAACMGRLPYAGALLQMAEMCIGNDRRRTSALLTLSANGGNSTDFGYRIRRLIGAEETTRVGLTRRGFAVGITMLSLFIVSLVSLGQTQKSANDEKPADEVTEKIFTPALRLPEHSSVCGVAIPANSGKLASLAWETAADQVGLRVTVRTWDLVDRKLAGEVDLEWKPDWTHYVASLLLSRDGTRIVGLLDGQIAMWDAVSGKITHRHNIPEEITNDKLYSVGLSNLTGTPDLSRIAFGRSVSLGGTLPSADAIVMDTDSGRVIQQVKMERRVRVKSLALSTDGRRLATVGSQNGVSLWDVASGQLVLDFRNDNTNRKHPDPKIETSVTQQVISVGFSPDGESFAVSDMLGVKLVDTQSGRVLRSIDAPHRYHDANPQFIFSADGQLFTLLGTLPEDGEPRTISIWSAESGERLRTLAIRATAAAFSTDGNWFTAGKADFNEALSVWQIREDKPAKPVVSPPDGARKTENPANGQGVLKGRLTLAGVMPLLPKLRVPTPTSPRLSKRATEEERKKYDASLVEIDDESLRADAERGLANAFVYLAKAPSNWQPPQEDLKPLALTLQDYRFEPRAAIVRTGQAVQLKNAGVAADNVSFNPTKNAAQNRMVNAGSDITLERPFTTSEEIPIQAKSQLNPWKSTFLLPLDHPFAAITDKQGRFSIAGLPAGEHRFYIWHERTGWLEKSLGFNIQAGQTTEANRSYSTDRFRLAANQNQTNTSPTDVLWGEPVGGMRLGMRLSEFARRRSPLRHGEHLDYEVWIKNETDEVFQIARDPRELYSPRLMDDQSINLIGGGIVMDFFMPAEELAKAELILPPGQAAHRFPMPNHAASIRPPGSPRGRYGSDPLHLEPGKYPVYAQLGELKSGVEEVEIIPAARLQIRKASRVTEKKREYAAADPSEVILAWQTGAGEKQEAMVNWDHGIMADERDLAAVEIVAVEGQPDQYSILIQLRAESASWLAHRIKSYSLWDDPDMVAILLDGKPLMATRLDPATPVSKILFNGRFTQKEAGDIASKIRSSKNSNWITAPQLCVGKAYSDTAKSANWKQDNDQRTSLATPENDAMLASVLPGAHADFVTWTRLRLAEGSLCRLTIGEATYDLTHTGEKTRLVTAGREYTFDNDAKFPEWTTLRITRRENKMSVQVNQQPDVDLGSNARAIQKISLQSTRGTIAVSHFVVTGNVQKVNQPQADADQQSDSRKRSFKLVDEKTGNPLQGLECQAIIAKRNASPRFKTCTTDKHGIVEVVLAADEWAEIAEVPRGWFSKGGPVFVEWELEAEQQPQRNSETQNEEPTVLKLWRGTEVDGRLLWPDKTPAAGVKLTAGVYISSQSWKEKLGMDLTWYSFDHGDWPNWSRTIVTDADGKFSVTVPPPDSRFWFRIGTTQLDFSPQTGAGGNEAVTQRLTKCLPLEIQYGGNSQSNLLIVHDIPGNDEMDLRAGDLQLENGVIVRGHVVDAAGKGLSYVRLTTTGPHGPHSGRSATSGEDGSFEFPAIAAGNLTVHPDARLRDVTKPIPEQVTSRDVQAVFVDQSFTIPSVFLPHEITVRAVPHTELTFEWVDRRADKTQPIAYYGTFRVRGYMPDETGKPATYWTSETERVERNGKQWLTVKIPTHLLKPELMLVADSRVTASYRDSTNVASGPGIVQLGDITANTTRTIFGDDPLQSQK
jgi:beta-lactamase regulating signal transducer with metallopeptidase domain/WD40 repeat protein